MDILERLKGHKVPVNITIDEELFNRLQKLKQKKQIKTLSPVINEILWDWVNAQENKKVKIITHETGDPTAGYALVDNSKKIELKEEDKKS